MPRQPGDPARSIAASTLVVVGVALGLFLFVHFVGVVLAFFGAVLLSAAVRPLVARLESRGVARPVAAIFAHLLLIAVVVGFALVAAPLLAEQGAALIAELPAQYAAARTWLLESQSSTLRRVAYALPLHLAHGAASTSDVSDLVGWARAAVSGGLTAIAVLVLSFYWTVQGELTTRTLLHLLPLDRREAANAFVAAASEKLSAYIRGQLVVCLAVGVCALIAYLVIGLPNAFALAAVAGVLEAVPIIGPVLGAIPAGLVALTIDPTMALWVALSTSIIQTLENYLLVPRVMDRAVGVNPLISILAIAAFGALFGVIGALLAIPLAALLQLVFARVVVREESAAPAPPRGRGQLSAMRYEVQRLVLDVRKLVRTKDELASAAVDAIEDELEAIATELDQILGRAEAEAEAESDGDRERAGVPA